MEGVAREIRKYLPRRQHFFLYSFTWGRIDCKFDLRIQIDITVCNWGKVYRVHKLHRCGW